MPGRVQPSQQKYVNIAKFEKLEDLTNHASMTFSQNVYEGSGDDERKETLCSQLKFSWFAFVGQREYGFSFKRMHLSFEIFTEYKIKLPHC